MRPQLILVDDATAVRSVLRTLLNSNGYEVVGDYGSGKQLLEAIEKLTPQIVCLDYNLPDIDGLTLLRQVREKFPEVAVVMITGSNDSTMEHNAALAGAAGFIRKPFSQDSILAEMKKVLLTQNLLVSTRLTGKSTPGVAVRAKALVADDSQTMRMLLVEILKQAGVEVVAECCDGQQAVEMAAKHQPDIVCLDINMPVKNGLEALKEIHAQNPAAKIMMITAMISREAVTQAGSFGAKGYILKPYQPEKVIQAITQLLKL